MGEPMRYELLEQLRADVAPDAVGASGQPLSARQRVLGLALVQAAVAEIDRLRALLQLTAEPGPPEARWAHCELCRTLVDRFEEHVVESYALEVLHGEHDIETREAHPGRVWHPVCAPTTWRGAR